MEYMSFLRIFILGMTVLFVLTMGVILLFNRQKTIRSKNDKVRQRVINNTQINSLNGTNTVTGHFVQKVESMEYKPTSHSQIKAEAYHPRFQVVKISSKASR